MRLYLDNNYQPGIYKIISQIHGLKSPTNYEIIYRDWQDEYNAKDTIVFLINLNKKSIDSTALGYYKDGYKVFIYRKPYDQEFCPYTQAPIMMNHWRKILETIESDSNPYIYSINNRTVTKLK